MALQNNHLGPFRPGELPYGDDDLRSDARCPAVYISWNDVQDLIGRLNQAEGEDVYRLPTEAEWEYACRAGTVTHWSFGDDEGRLGQYAWFNPSAPAMDDEIRCARPVGTRRANRWGLFDMHGNVCEWVQDGDSSLPYDEGPVSDPQGSASGRSRMTRGGGYSSFSFSTRSAHRHGAAEDRRDNDLGARLVRVE
ncbi:formylglycine-generating enzyme family protein [Candidatus Latescibacterota bacterium]